MENNQRARMRIQFGLKFLLLLTTIAAIGCYVIVQRNRYEQRWASVRVRLEEWEARHGSYPQSSYAFDVENRNGEQVFVAIGTSYFLQNENNIAAGPKDPLGRPRKKYYVTPPGKWVNDLEGALRIWDKL